jgi:hypothetical protein
MAATTTAPVRLYMSMSLDGFIAGPDDRAGQELGRNGGRLFNWLDDRMSPGINGQVYREAMATGAVISGRRTFELAGRWNGDHHDGVPIHVLTHHLVPVLPGAGRPLFGPLGTEPVELRLVRRLDGRDATHLRYQVR